MIHSVFPFDQKQKFDLHLFFAAGFTSYRSSGKGPKPAVGGDA
jgi:hypothetical protein